MSVLSACKNKGMGLRFDLSPTLCVMALNLLFSNIAWLDDHELALFSKIDLMILHVIFSKIGWRVDAETLSNIRESETAYSCISPIR